MTSLGPHLTVFLREYLLSSAQEFAKCSIGGQLSVSAKTKPTSGGEIALWAATRRQQR